MHFALNSRAGDYFLPRDKFRKVRNVLPGYCTYEQLYELLPPCFFSSALALQSRKPLLSSAREQSTDESHHTSVLEEEEDFSRFSPPHIKVPRKTPLAVLCGGGLAACTLSLSRSLIARVWRKLSFVPAVYISTVQGVASSDDHEMRGSRSPAAADRVPFYCTLFCPLQL